MCLVQTVVTEQITYVGKHYSPIIDETSTFFGNIQH